MICSVCSIENHGNGRLQIHDHRKYLTSPIPCPECSQRFKDNLQEFFRQRLTERIGKFINVKQTDIGVEADIMPMIDSMSEQEWRLNDAAVRQLFCSSRHNRLDAIASFPVKVMLVAQQLRQLVQLERETNVTMPMSDLLADQICKEFRATFGFDLLQYCEPEFKAEHQNEPPTNCSQCGAAGSVMGLCVKCDSVSYLPGDDDGKTE